MPEKKKKPTVKSLPPRKLSDQEAAKVKGGMTVGGGVGGVTGGGVFKDVPENCKATGETGIKGCPG